MMPSGTQKVAKSSNFDGIWPKTQFSVPNNDQYRQLGHCKGLTPVSCIIEVSIPIEDVSKKQEEFEQKIK